MPIHIGNTEIKDVRVGNTPVQEVRVGNTLVWTRTVAPTMSAISNQNVAYNANFNLDVGALTTGTTPTYSATGLPSGLAIDSGTGVISGRSTNSGSHSITVTATNVAGSASRSFTITIANPVLAWSNIPQQITFNRLRTTTRDFSQNLNVSPASYNLEFILEWISSPPSGSFSINSSGVLTGRPVSGSIHQMRVGVRYSGESNYLYTPQIRFRVSS